MKLSKEEKYLINKDNKLKKVINNNGHIVFKSSTKNQFDNLVGIVIAQFISTSASNSIFKKIKDIFNVDYMDPIHFKELNINQIKDLGVTLNKAKTIKELSELFLSKNFVDFTDMDEKEMNDKLNSIFGIGPWSIAMFEIFCLGKINIFSSKDAGLRLAMNNCGMTKENSKRENYDIYAERWSPYKSIASIHLWKTLD